jgi:hypothetical protein
LGAPQFVESIVFSRRAISSRSSFSVIWSVYVLMVFDWLNLRR